MKKLFKGKFNIYDMLFFVMAVLFAANCVDHYFVEVSTQMSAGTLLSTMFAGGIIPWIKNDKFTALAEEEIKKLEADDLGKYHKALSENKETTMKELIDSKASTEDIVKLQKEISEMKEASKDEAFTKSLTELEENFQKQIDEAGIAITKLEDGVSIPKTKTVYAIIKEAIEGDVFKEYLKSGITGNSKKMELDMKAITDVAGYTNAVVIPNRQGPQVAFQPPKRFDIRDAMATGTSDSSTIDHLKETGFVDGAGFLAENAQSGESEIQLEEVTTTAKRIATHINVSKRALKNPAFLTSYLSNRFPGLIAQALTDSVLNGTGAGNQFDGLFNNAVVFTAGDLAAKVDEANTADVLAAALARLSEITNLQGNAIFINPLDEYLLTATKDTTGQYAENGVVVTRINGRLHINGVPVWSTFHVAADKYLVADLSADTTGLFEHEALSMFIAEQHGTNAIENQVTFIFEMEAILPIFQTFAFLKGTISADKALLETV